MPGVPGANLTDGERDRAQRVAVSALARGRSNADAADLASISRSTLQAWLRDPHFRTRIEQEQQRLETSEPDAVRTLRAALYDPSVTANMVNAAKALLSLVPDEAAPTTPSEVVFYLDAAAVERVLTRRSEVNAEAGEAFREKQQAQAARVERLYQRDEKPPRVVPDVRQDEA